MYFRDGSSTSGSVSPESQLDTFTQQVLAQTCGPQGARLPEPPAFCPRGGGRHGEQRAPP
eukprot:3750412-Pyramimonas_sp.AAC.1